MSTKAISIHGIHEKSVGNRINFAGQKNPVDYPDFLEIQLKSFKDFFQLETTSENRSQEGVVQGVQ